jgi:adenosylhomocysteine nucleosidase
LREPIRARANISRSKIKLFYSLHFINRHGNIVVKNGQGKIFVLISADEEWKIVKQILNPGSPLSLSPFGEWFEYEFEVGGKRFPTIFFQIGCGKIPAAAATQHVLDRWQPSLIINLGTCGGFKGKVKKDDILLVIKTVVYDIYERAGNHDEQIAKYTSVLDLSWLNESYPTKIVPATIATADQDLDPKNIKYLHQKYGAVAADWESGAIAYVANRNNNTNCLILRGVSDVIDSINGEPSSNEKISRGTKTVMKKLIDALPSWLAELNEKVSQEHHSD